MTFLFPEEITRNTVPTLGGKAAGLYHLTRAGFPVPAWCVLPASMYPFDIKRVHASLGPVLERLGAGPYAVRSSATVEDAASGSFSGQFETRLDVEGLDAVLAAIESVSASLRSERAVAALARAGNPPVRMAVIVQRQVRAQWSGVLHSVNLPGERLDQVLVGLVEGAGEKLVSGAESGETWALPPAQCLSGAGKIRPPDELVAIARAAEAYFGCPQDIEIAHDGAKLHLLQSRPLVMRAAAFHTDPLARPDLALWDSSNIAESYAGPTKPLTFSFIRQSYANVYRETGETLGLDLADVRANEPYYQKLLGYFRGRVYYNLLSWYQLVLQLPGGEDNARHMEAMMGVKEPLPGASARLPSRTKRARYAVRLLSLYRQGPRLISEFQEHFDRVFAQHRGAFTPQASLHELARIYRALESDLKGRWAAPILADVFSMVFVGVVRALARKWKLEDERPITELLAPRGLGIATAPVTALEEIALQIRANPAWQRIFAEATPAQLAAQLADDAALAPVRQALDRYLEQYGDRFAGELKLEEPPLRDNPEWVLSLLKGRVLGAADDAGRRASDRARVDAREAAALAQLSAPRRLLFRWALGGARRFIASREIMRYDRSRLFGLARDLLHAMGRRLHAASNLDAPDDVHFLACDEVLGFIEGTALTTDLAAIARLRRAEWERDRAQPPPPERFWTVGAAYAWTPLVPRASTPTSSIPGALTGIAAYPGRVRAVARVVADPARAPDLQGKILVARSNDPGWVTLYPGIAGLLLERGSVLSHAANMAREMGIPAILGVAGLLQHVNDGDTVVMDATRGTVVVEKKETPPPPAEETAPREKAG